MAVFGKVSGRLTLCDAIDNGLFTRLPSAAQPQLNRSCVPHIRQSHTKRHLGSSATGSLA